MKINTVHACLTLSIIYLSNLLNELGLKRAIWYGTARQILTEDWVYLAYSAAESISAQLGTGMGLLGTG